MDMLKAPLLWKQKEQEQNQSSEEIIGTVESSSLSPLSTSTSITEATAAETTTSSETNNNSRRRYDAPQQRQQAERQQLQQQPSSSVHQTTNKGLFQLAAWLGLLLMAWLVSKGWCSCAHIPSDCQPGFESAGAMEDLQYLFLYGLSLAYMADLLSVVEQDDEEEHEHEKYDNQYESGGTNDEEENNNDNNNNHRRVGHDDNNNLPSSATTKMSHFDYVFDLRKRWYFFVLLFGASPVCSLLGEIPVLQGSISPGGNIVTTLVLVLLLVLIAAFVIGWHVCHAHRCRTAGPFSFRMYLVSRIGVIVFYVLTIVVGVTRYYTYHIHHYFIAYVLALFACFNHPVSVSVLGLSAGIFVQGLAAYNFADLFQIETTPSVL